MGPLDSIFCWQALLVALTASGLTQFIKTVMDVVWGTNDPTPTPTLDVAKAVGASIRKRNLILNRVVLPAIQVFAGFLIAVLIPLRPDNLTHWVEVHNVGQWQALAMYGLWGATCGQFADYGVSKVKDFFESKRAIHAETQGQRTTAEEDHAP